MGFSGKKDVFFRKIPWKISRALDFPNFFQIASQSVLLLKNNWNVQKMGFWENSWNCLGEIPANFQKRFFGKFSIEWVRTGNITWELSQRLNFGAYCEITWVFSEKNFILFKIALTGKVFVVWFSNILTVKIVKISQEFLTFFLSWKKERSFEKSLIF